MIDVLQEVKDLFYDRGSTSMFDKISYLLVESCELDRRWGERTAVVNVFIVHNSRSPQ
jgi:hypothetical protein